MMGMKLPNFVWLDCAHATGLRQKLKKIENPGTTNFDIFAIVAF